VEQPVLERSDANGIVTLTLNRPERRNALSIALVSALSDAFTAIAADASVRVVIITGSGRGFCAGGDLAEGMGRQQGFVDAHRSRGVFADLLREMVNCPVPVIAAVNGHALGGGFGLAMAADLVVMDPSATVGTPEVRVGLFPMIILAVLTRVVPHRVLREMVFTGERMSAQDALKYGMVNQVSAAGESVSEAIQKAEVIARRSPTAIRMGKRAMAVTDGQSLDESLAYLHQALTLNLMTEDAAEGIAAFVSKREPTFRGR
jgi:enoyl-CoA hydratase/carnithine racemase